MGKDNVFNRLVKDLSDQERLKMLEKIEEKIRINQDPIDIHVENEEIKSIDQEYNELSWLERIIILIKSFFLSQDKFDLTKKHMLKSIDRKIQYMNSQYFNIKTQSATKEFYLVLSELGRSIEFAKKPLASCFNDEKIPFYLLMGKLEFPQIFEELESVLDPTAISTRNPSLDSQEIKKKLSAEMDEIIARITKEDRMRMMESTRVLFHMYCLSNFPFSQILGNFPVDQQGEILPASFSIIRKSLNDLGSLLNSFYSPPGLKLMEAVFLSEYARMEKPEIPMEEYLKSSMVKTGHLVERIREFNRNVYLIDILKVINEDPFYSPEDIGGGEDWFHYYNQYWQEVSAGRMKVFARARQVEAEKSELVRFWEVEDVLILNNYNESRGFCVHGATMSLLKTFLKEIVQKLLYYPLKIILVEGEFYKKNNRSEFEEIFNSLMKLGERLSWFERNLEPDGEGGMKIREALHRSGGDDSAAEELLNPVYAGINRDALVILEDAIKILFSLGKLLNGILLGNGGTYDTLANFPDLGGKKNAELREAVQTAADQVHKMSHSLQDLLNLEKDSLKD